MSEVGCFSLEPGASDAAAHRVGWSPKIVNVETEGTEWTELGEMAVEG